MANEPLLLTPRAYQNSIRNRARNASQTQGIPAGELIDLHYHRRLLARVFHDNPASWVLKGGQALLVRWPAARYSTDVDLLSDQDTTDAAVEALIEATAIDLDDHIRFAHHDTSEQTHIDRPTRKVRFRAMFGNAELKMVSVDVVASGHQPRGTVTREPLVPPFPTDCNIWPDVRMFPIEDHVAEKICAMYERYRVDGKPSSRYKDLVDLVLIALKSSLDGPDMHETLRQEIHRREARNMVLKIPNSFQVPDSSWTDGYRKIAKDVHDLPNDFRTVAGVRQFADAFITPLLQSHPPAGDWRPVDRTWR